MDPERQVASELCVVGVASDARLRLPTVVLSGWALWNVRSLPAFSVYMRAGT